MNEIYHIEYVEKEEETASKVIWPGIQNHMIEQAGDPEPRHLCFVLYSPDKEIVGGVVGDQYWDWIYINFLTYSEIVKG